MAAMLSYATTNFDKRICVAGEKALEGDGTAECGSFRHDASADNPSCVNAAQLSSQADKPPVRWPGGRAASGGSELHGGMAAALAPAELSLVAAAALPQRGRHVRRLAA